MLKSTAPFWNHGTGVPISSMSRQSSPILARISSGVPTFLFCTVSSERSTISRSSGWTRSIAGHADGGLERPVKKLLGQVIRPQHVALAVEDHDDLGEGVEESGQSAVADRHRTPQGHRRDGARSRRMRSEGPEAVFIH